MIDLSELHLAALIGIFAIGAIVVWFSGAKLSNYGELIAARTGIDRAFIGLILLAGATSLPELATTVTAAAIESAELAVSNALGGVAMQTAVLAFTDLVMVRGALTFFTPRTVLMVQGLLLIIMLALVIAAISLTSEWSIMHVSVWTTGLFATYLGGVYLVHRYENNEAWEPVNAPDDEDRNDEHLLREKLESRFEKVSNANLYARFAGVALLVAFGGWAVAVSGESIASRTGMSHSFFGATFVALSTSLPEVSTTIAATRLGAYSMAVSNIFGSNAIDVALLWPADLVYQKGSILSAVEPSAILPAAIGIILTCVYLWGLVERSDRSWLRLGIDSWCVIVIYAASLVLLYSVT